MKFQDFINLYKDGSVSITEDISYNLIDVIRKNERLKNSKFLEANYPNGDPKFFYNIGWIMKQTAFRGSNMGTKDLELHAETETAVKIAPLFKAALKQYLKDTNYDTVMNEDRDRFIDGHLLTKQVDNETRHVNLLNVIRPAHIMDFSGGIAEKTFPTYDEVLSYKTVWEEHRANEPEEKRKNWEEVQKVLDQINSTGGKFTVYEYWTRDKFKVGGKEKETLGCIKYLDCMPAAPTDSQDKMDWVPYLELDRFATPCRKKIRSKRKIKKLVEQGYIEDGEDSIPVFPYKERRLFTLEGRWMGVGVWELLSYIIEHYNENWGNKRMFDQLANKGIKVLRKGTGDDTQSLTQDFLNNIPTGGILEIENDEELTELRTTNITLDHLQTVDKLFELARQLMGLSAALTQQETPASQSATQSAIDQQNAKTTYQIITEELSLYYQELFDDFKMEDIIENMTEEEWVKASGGKDELEEAEVIFLENTINEQLTNNAKSGVFTPTGSQMPDEEMQRINQAARVVRAQQGGLRFPEFTKKMKKFFKFSIEFFVKNETFDKFEALKQIDAMIQFAMARPDSSLSVDKLIEAKMELLDMPVNRFKKSPEEVQQAQQMMMAAQNPNPVMQSAQ